MVSVYKHACLRTDRRACCRCSCTIYAKPTSRWWHPPFPLPVYVPSHMYAVYMHLREHPILSTCSCFKLSDNVKLGTRHRVSLPPLPELLPELGVFLLGPFAKRPLVAHGQGIVHHTQPTTSTLAKYLNHYDNKKNLRHPRRRVPRLLLHDANPSLDIF